MKTRIIQVIWLALLLTVFVPPVFSTPNFKRPGVLKTGGIIRGYSDEEKDRHEFQGYCNQLEIAREASSDEQRNIRVTECAVTAANEFDIDIDGKMLFTLIMIVAWGAMVRSVLKCYEIALPYTVVLMISGLIIGAFSKAYCEPLHEYTAIARISSKVILFTFLPILIFESAFNIPVHKFYRSGAQV
jgi:hypothetical protein